MHRTVLEEHRLDARVAHPVNLRECVCQGSEGQIKSDLNNPTPPHLKYPDPLVQPRCQQQLPTRMELDAAHQRVVGVMLRGGRGEGGAQAASWGCAVGG